MCSLGPEVSVHTRRGRGSVPELMDQFWDNFNPTHGLALALNVKEVSTGVSSLRLAHLFLRA